MNREKIKSYILYSSLIFLFSILIFAGYYYSKIKEDDGVRINLNGRQRMLSQKITKEILLYRIGEISPDKIRNSLKIFSETQNALINGGKAPLDLKAERYRYLSVTSDTDALEKLSEVSIIWKPIEDKILESINSGNPESLKYIITHNDSLLAKIDESVYSLQVRSEKNDMNIRLVIICSFIIITALLIFNLAARIKELKSAALTIKELEKLLPICSSCKRIRINDDKPLEQNSWTSIEEYLHTKKDMTFTHSICPECVKKLYPGLLEEIKK